MTTSAPSPEAKQKSALDFIATLLNNYISALAPGVKEVVGQQAQAAINELLPKEKIKED